MINIIPAIDIIDGKCVRLTQGNYDEMTIYAEDPLDIAKQIEDHGIKRLHLVDLDGAKSAHVVNWKVLERIKSKTSLFVDFGGGVKSDEDARIVFDSGADQLTAGSIAVKDPTTFYRWLSYYGADKIILGADTRDGKVAISGWQEESEDFWSFLDEKMKSGVKYVISTDVTKDGMLMGSSIELYKKMIDKFPDINLIASGGVQSMEEIVELDDIGCHGVIVGKAIYEGIIDLKQIEKYILYAD